MQVIKTERFAWAVVAMIIASVLFGCSGGQKKYRIAVSQCSSDDWRQKVNEEIRREAMFYNDVEVEIRSADDNSDRQIADLDYFMNNDFDIIIVAPNEATALTPKIKEIYESGKPVIVFDRNINGPYYTAFQGADNAGIGKMAAIYAGTLVDSPKILELRGLKGSSPADLRHDGFAMAADSLGYHMAVSVYGDWNGDRAKALTDSLLDIYKETNVIYAHNDIMAIGAREATKKHGREDIRIIGIDAAPTVGVKAVEEGVIDATFVYPTNGDELIKSAMQILKGEPYDKHLLHAPSAPVDRKVANFLQMQDKSLRAETDKVVVLQQRVSEYLEMYSEQKKMLYLAGMVLVLASAFIFLLLRMRQTGKKHRMAIESSNKELARQRDELNQLYTQLEEATGSKLTFFTNVSHDLRTPLTLIADPVSQIAKSQNLSAQERTLMQLANKNVVRLQHLVDQILDIRKYDSGHLSLRRENINLTDAMHEWTEPFNAIAAKRGIKFHTELPKAPIVLSVDVEKTERIMFNLLSNAFKFTPDRGNINVSLQRQGEQAIIKVEDSGIGIAVDEINQVFDRFFKTDRINPNGSGIGLALSKVFIEMQGGSIDVESQEGKGSVFTVKIPISLVDNEARPVQSTIASEEVVNIETVDVEVAEDTPTVLVIDDNRDICTLVKTILSSHYTVLVANNGKQGIGLATKYVPDIIICDVMMPGMDGYQVCQALKQEPLTSHIPVLMLTACSRDEQRLEGYQHGADAYMPKPFDSEMLLARVKSLIENRILVQQHFSATVEETSSPAVKKSPSPKAPKQDEFLERFTQLVESNISDKDLSVESLADKMGISRVQLYRKIKALTNYSVAEMIRVIRLRKAAILLKTTDTTISEISYAVGFSSPSYFSRCYKDQYGESPIDTQSRTGRTR